MYMKYFVLLNFFLFIRSIYCNRFDSSANVSDVNDEKHVIQKRFGFLKKLFGFGSSDDDAAGPTIIIDRRFRRPSKRRRRVKSCSSSRPRYRRPAIDRRNFDLSPNNATYTSKYNKIVPTFKQPPDDIYYYSFPNGVPIGDRHINMFEPVPGDLLYPPMTTTTIQPKFNLHTKGPKLYPFYEHEAINLLPQTPSTMSNEMNNLYRRDVVNMKPVYERSTNILQPSKYYNNNYKITIVTPSPVDKNILTLSKLINDRRKKVFYQQQQQHQNQKQNSQENLFKLNLKINNLKSSRSIIFIPLKGTSTNLSSKATTSLIKSHQSNYHHYPDTELFKNPLDNNKNVKLMDKSNDRYQYYASGSNDQNKMTRDEHVHDHYDTYNLHNTHTYNKTNNDDRIRMSFDQINVQNDLHPKMNQVNDQRNNFKIYNIEPNYNWVNVGTKSASGDPTNVSLQKYSSSLPATENPISANSILAAKTKII